MKTWLSKTKLFNKFCELDSDRMGIIRSILEKEDIPFTIINLDKAKHILIYPHNLPRKEETTVLLAHYDRVSDTPGANDNSASIFYLLFHAKKLKNLDHTTLIIFTDKEEIGSSESVTDQGAYALGKYFKSKKLDNLRFFVFDMCGIGTTIMLGTAGKTLIKEHYGNKYETSSIKQKIDKVKEDAEETLLTINAGEFFYLTPLFSDDLGLILNEYPAVLISLLPYREAVEYKKDPSKLPKSWLCNHTMNDTLDTLDPKSWDVLSPLLSRLSELPEANEVKQLKELSFNCYTQVVESKTEKNRIKPTLNYIIKPSFDIYSIKSSNTNRLELFLLFSSKLMPIVVDFFESNVTRNSKDLSLDIYFFIKEKVENEFKLLPLIIRDSIIKRSKDSSNIEIINFLYNNVISFIDYEIISTPINIKEKIDMEIIKEDNGYNLILSYKDKKIGTIYINRDNRGFYIDEGHFIPDNFLGFDPLNILKGIRLLLIKWVKLNNNDSLRFNLIPHNWIGCYQFYKLIEMELDTKTREPKNSNLVYLWKRYNV